MDCANGQACRLHIVFHGRKQYQTYLYFSSGAALRAHLANGGSGRLAVAVEGSVEVAGRSVPLDLTVASYRRLAGHAAQVWADVTANVTTLNFAMSKSIGNVLVPQKLTGTLGADVVRLWVAATDYSNEMSVSDEILKRMADSYRRMRNTLRFLLSNMHGFDPEQQAVPWNELVAIDQWAISKSFALQNDLVTAFRNYEFHVIYQRIHNFCVVELGGFYLDIIKDRLYTTGAASAPRRSAQTAMYHIAEAMVRWLAPILSFTAEEAWSFLPGVRSESVFLDTWHRFPPGAERGSEIEWAAFIKEFIKPRRFELVVLGLGTGSDPDQYVVWHSSQRGPDQMNRTGYANDEVDHLLEAGRASCVQKDRVRAYHRIQEILAEDLPMIFLFNRDSLPVVTSRIRGVSPSPSGILHNFNEWYVPKTQQRYTSG